MSDVLDALLRLHDGDDRCGCLRMAIRYLDQSDRATAVDVIHTCLMIHPAGSIYRTEKRSTVVEHGVGTSVEHGSIETDGRTDGERTVVQKIASVSGSIPGNEGR